jgi:hypothetical protein
VNQCVCVSEISYTRSRARYSKDAQEGLDCCSPRYVSSHYAWPDTMRYLDDAHEQGCEGRGLDPI